jgi:hypothetical protein
LETFIASPNCTLPGCAGNRGGDRDTWHDYLSDSELADRNLTGRVVEIGRLKIGSVFRNRIRDAEADGEQPRWRPCPSALCRGRGAGGMRSSANFRPRPGLRTSSGFGIGGAISSSAMRNHMPPIVRSIGRISVVIPTLNEAQRLPALLAALDREPELAETIVADGGSSDGTGDIAERLGAVVVSAERGRGCQLRAGAAAARGEILLFLHADSVFPSGGLGAIAAALGRRPRNYRTTSEVL